MLQGTGRWAGPIARDSHVQEGCLLASPSVFCVILNSDLSFFEIHDSR